MHGNPVTFRDLRFRKSRRYPPLLSLAPILYNVALRAYMKSMFALSLQQQGDDTFFGKIPISRALTVVRNGTRPRE
jgi:hypothetical protein